MGDETFVVVAGDDVLVEDSIDVETTDDVEEIDDKLPGLEAEVTVVFVLGDVDVGDLVVDFAVEEGAPVLVVSDAAVLDSVD